MHNDANHMPQEQLTETEQRWQRILASSNDAFIGIDQHSVITDWNPRAEELFGWSADEVIGTQLADTLIPPEFRTQHHAGMQRFLDEGVDNILFRSLEVPALHRTGRRIPVDLRVWPAQIDGQWRFHAFLHDLSERQRIEAHMQLLEEVTTAANASMEAHQAVQVALSKICAMTGWPVGHAYLVSPDDPELLEPSGWWHLDERLEHFPAVTDGRQFATGVGLPGRVLQTGRPQWVTLATAENFPRAEAAGADGLDSGFAFPVLTGSSVVAVLEFYTRESVDADQELLDLVRQVGTQLGRVFERQRALEDLADASHMRLRMMSMLSHDVGNPLAVIRGYAGALSEDADHLSPEELRHYTAGISRMSARLDALMSDLLTGLRAESGRLPASPTTFDVREAVEQVADDLQFDALRVDIPAGLTVHADRGQLLQILENLFTNADKYGTPPVGISATQHGSRTILAVTDHGPGLPPEFASDLFAPFARGPSADNTTGTGLGLWICRHLARQNRGDLFHQPEGDTSARFVIDLPMAGDAC